MCGRIGCKRKSVYGALCRECFAKENNIKSEIMKPLHSFEEQNKGSIRKRKEK